MQVRALRGRLVHRDGDPVQVAALPRERAADLGHQLPAGHPLEERVRGRDADARGVRPIGPRRRCRWPRRWSASSTPARSRNLELKPYVVSVVDDRPRPPPSRSRTDFTRDVGVDFKYGLSRSLTADVTVNTDFAQIEEDLQQINLTRFNLLFPEKRDFFLEGQGIYAFGGRSLAGRGAGDTDDVPVMFFSRQIGLASGQTIPVIAGGRVTGKAGRVRRRRR